MPEPEENKFKEAGNQSGNSPLIKEFLDFLMHSKKWWMLPILIIMLLFGILIILGGTGAAPFIYTLF